MVDVSIIIINYKSARLVLDCLASVFEQTRQHSFEVIVVDNDSKDNCKGLVLQQYPSVVWVQMDYNTGFARANNEGIKISNGEFILLLNADTIVLDSAIDKSISLLKNNSGAIGCGVQLLNTDGSTQISGAHFIKGGLNTLLPLPYLGKLIRYLGYQFKSTIPSVQNIKDDIEVDWIVGAYILVKKNILPKSGLLDEDFFMYAEEIEWCARLRKQGKLYLFAEPKVIHIGGGTSGDYYKTSEGENSKNLWNKKGRQIIISNMVRIRKQFGIFWYLLIISFYVMDIPVFVVCLAIEKILKGKQAKYSWQNFIDYTRNIFLLLQFFFKILLNKPYFYKIG